MHAPDVPARIREALEFVRRELLPRLAGLPPPADFDLVAPAADDLTRARRWVIARECLALDGVTRHAIDHDSGPAPQTLVAAAAAALELAVDVLLLADRDSGERVRQVLAFDAVRCFQAEEKRAQFRARAGQAAPAPSPWRVPQPELGPTRAPAPTPTSASTPASFIGPARPSIQADERARIETLVRHVWGFTRKGTPRFPEHWSALRFSQRLDLLRVSHPGAADILESLYREGYARVARGRTLRVPLGTSDPTAERLARWHRLMLLEIWVQAIAAALPTLAPDLPAGAPLPQALLPQAFDRRALDPEFHILDREP